MRIYASHRRRLHGGRGLKWKYAGDGLVLQEATSEMKVKMKTCTNHLGRHLVAMLRLGISLASSHGIIRDHDDGF